MGMGHLKATRRNKVHLQENSIRIDKTGKSKRSHLAFWRERKTDEIWFENLLDQISIMVINRFVFVWFVLLLFLFCPENAVLRNRVWSDL